MTRKLEEIFDLPMSSTDEDEVETTAVFTEEARTLITEIDDTIDKIDIALPAVRDLTASDPELDEIAKKSSTAFDDLMTLGFNVDSRFSAEIFAVAKGMLDTTLSAKQAKLNKKLKMIDLQLKKAKLDLDERKLQQSLPPEDQPETAHGQILTRNDLLELIKGPREQNEQKE